jgi:hypothetical protein
MIVQKPTFVAARRTRAFGCPPATMPPLLMFPQKPLDVSRRGKATPLTAELWLATTFTTCLESDLRTAQSRHYADLQQRNSGAITCKTDRMQAVAVHWFRRASSSCSEPSGGIWRICSRSPHACRIAFCLAEGTACPSRRRARGSFSLLACALSPEFAARNQPLTPHMGGAAEWNITARKVSTAKPPPQ